MRLNASATAAISSPPIAGARAVRSPSPNRLAASSSARSRACAGLKIASAASAVPPIRSKITPKASGVPTASANRRTPVSGGTHTTATIASLCSIGAITGPRRGLPNMRGMPPSGGGPPPPSKGGGPRRSRSSGPSGLPPGPPGPRRRKGPGKRMPRGISVPCGAIADPSGKMIAAGRCNSFTRRSA